jgi:hypothetical protein
MSASVTLVVVSKHIVTLVVDIQDIALADIVALLHVVLSKKNMG